MPNNTEYRTSIGLDSVYIAEVLQDDSSAYVTDTPVYLAPVAQLSGVPKINEEQLYYDDQAFETLISEGVTERKLTVANLPPAIEAMLTGEIFDAVSGRIIDTADPSQAPYFALGYRAKKSNGKYKYFWFLKGKFQKPAAEHTTVGEKAEAKPLELTFNAQRTIYKWTFSDRTEGVKRIAGDEDTDNFSATSWFNAVQTPDSSSASALTCTPSPADAATGVLATANITLTFNNRIVTGNSGILLTKSDGTVVSATYAWNAAVKVLTIDPASSLAAGGDYLIALSGVTDIYGQTLANTVYNFTVAS